MEHRFAYLVTGEEQGLTLAWMLRGRGFSRRVLTDLKRNGGQVLKNGKPAFFSDRVSAGDQILASFPEPDSPANLLPAPVPFSIVYEDEHLLVADKPAGVPTHPSAGNHDNTLANGLAWHFAQKGEPFTFRCMGRLDRDTSGLVLVARHALAGAILSEAVTRRGICRTYLALVKGSPPESGVVDAPIGRREGSIIERTVDMEKGERAVTCYRVLSRHEGYSFLELTLKTGRTHQIRVHMAYLGHPLLGDSLYDPEGFSDFPIGRQALHAGRLSFLHPVTGEAMTFTSELPTDMRRLLS